MAATDVIHFRFPAQLASRSLFPALLLPGPGAQISSVAGWQLSLSSPGRTSDRLAIHVPQQLYQRSDSSFPPRATKEIPMQKAHLYEAMLLGESMR